MTWTADGKYVPFMSMVEILGEKNATFLLTLKTRLLMTALIRMSQVGDFGVPPQRTMMQTGSGASARTPIRILGLQGTRLILKKIVPFLSNTRARLIHLVQQMVNYQGGSGVLSTALTLAIGNTVTLQIYQRKIHISRKDSEDIHYQQDFWIIQTNQTQLPVPAIRSAPIHQWDVIISIPLVLSCFYLCHPRIEI